MVVLGYSFRRVTPCQYRSLHRLELHCLELHVPYKQDSRREQGLTTIK